MGAECPSGHGRQNVIRNITADGSTPKKNSDVIAQKLACGCVVGGAEYEAFQIEVLKVRNAEKHALNEIRENTRKAIADAYKAFHVMEN